MAARAHTEDGETRCPHHDRMIELTGISGDKGRVGNLERSVKYVKTEAREALVEVKKDMNEIKKVQGKIILAVVLSASGGGAAAGFVFKLLS